MLIWTLVQQLGVDWPRAERQRRLFPVCVQVQAQLMARYPAYRPVNQHTVPEAVVPEVKEMLHAILRHERGGARPPPGAAPDPAAGL